MIFNYDLNFLVCLILAICLFEKVGSGGGNLNFGVKITLHFLRTVSHPKMM